jgi:hypothetical protein
MRVCVLMLTSPRGYVCGYVQHILSVLVILSRSLSSHPPASFLSASRSRSLRPSEELQDSKFRIGQSSRWIYTRI